MIEQGRVLLRFDGVHAYYGKAKILDDVSLNVGEGETLALIGRNGAGKTTALASIFGIATVRQGTISVAGRPLALRRKYEAAKRGVSIAPQGRRILSNLTVEENLLLGMAAGRKGHWSLAAVYDLFPILRQRAGTRGTALSGGQLQMLAIGRALLANPRVLLLDEPSEGLAPVLVDELAEVLVEIRSQGTAMVVVEQHITLIQRVADRYTVLAGGTVAANGSMTDFDAESMRSLIAV